MIESVWLGSKPEPLKSPAAKIVTALESRRIAGVRRVGKHIVFDLEEWVGRPALTAKRRKKAGCHQKKGGQECPPHTVWGAMDCASGDDRAHAGVPTGCEIERHTHAVAKLASGRELRFVDPRRFGRLSVARALKPRDRSHWRWIRRFCGSVPWAKDADQERPAKPETLERRGQHLCGRVAVSRQGQAAAAGCLAYAGRPGAALPGSPGGPEGSHCPRWFFRFRLRGLGRRRRFLSTATPRLWQRRRTLSGL